MEFADAFGPDVSPREFFLEKLPALHESRLDVFELFCETTLRLSIHLTDRDERYTVELRPDGARAREGDMIDFPTVTLEGPSQHWETVKEHAREIFEEGERQLRADPPTHRITRAFLDDLERYDAVIAVELTGAAFDGPLRSDIILNDYSAPPGARRAELHGSADLIWEVLDGTKTASEAADALDVSADFSLAFDLGGLILEHFPELEDN